MNKAELIDVLTDKMGTDRRQATAAVENVVDTIVRAVHKGDSVTITGFGVFEQRRRAARVARNPRTGETVKVKPTSVPAFRPGAQFKAVVSGAQRLPAEGPAVKRGVTAGGARQEGREEGRRQEGRQEGRGEAGRQEGRGEEGRRRQEGRCKAAAKKAVKRAAVKKAVKKAAAKKAVKKAAAKKAVKKAAAKKAVAKKAPAVKAAGQEGAGQEGLGQEGPQVVRSRLRRGIKLDPRRVCVWSLRPRSVLQTNS